MTTRLYIQTVLQNGQTYLAEAYASAPLKVANITEDKRGKQLQLMIMSSSPGVLDGDDYQLRMDVEAGCNLAVSTQSYQRLFTMQKGATQILDAHIGKGAFFSYLPHPTVPHASAVYKANNKLYLAVNSTLVWGEIVTCGRKLNGEEFMFSKLHITTDVYIDNKLCIKENLLLKPAEVNISAIGQWEGFTHQASLLFIHQTAAIPALIDKINVLLASEKAIMYGMSLAPVNGLVVRILGYKGEQLFDCLKKIGQLLFTLSAKQLPAYAS